MVSIIIVNWNTRDLLLQCIESVAHDCDGVETEIIVVDNASTDGSPQAVGEGYPSVRVIANERNLGFATASNQGVSEATGDYILLLNPDTVVHPGAISQMLGFLSERREVGIVGPLLLGADGRPQISSFGIFPSPLEAMLRAMRIWRLAPKSALARRFLIRPESPGEWVYSEHLLGACLLIRREVLDQVGGFDEDFFLFLEETDLCYRTKEAGWRVAFYTGASVTHLGEQSMQHILHRSGGLYIRSYNRFCQKHGASILSRGAVNVFLVLGVLGEAGVGLIRFRSPRRAANVLRALWYGYVARG